MMVMMGLPRGKAQQKQSTAKSQAMQRQRNAKHSKSKAQQRQRQRNAKESTANSSKAKPTHSRAAQSKGQAEPRKAEQRKQRRATHRKAKIPAEPKHSTAQHKHRKSKAKEKPPHSTTDTKQSKAGQGKAARGPPSAPECPRVTGWWCGGRGSPVLCTKEVRTPKASLIGEIQRVKKQNQ